MKRNVLVVDLDKCIGCKGCQIACKMENNVPLGSARSRVLVIGPTGSYPNLEMYFMPVMCQQCENPACVNVCPTGACYKDRAAGVVLIDAEKCIGCRGCIRACPYGIPSFNGETRKIDKCTSCMSLQEEGSRPACVKNCSSKALVYGDPDDPDSEVSVLLRETDTDDVHRLRDAGNHPTVCYVLRKAEWQDILPQECNELEERRRRNG